MSVRPQRSQRKRQRLERCGADVIALSEGRGEGPGAVAEGEGLQGAGVGVDQPEVGDGVGGVEGALFGQVEAAGRGGEDRRPSRGEVEEGGVGEDRQALAAPAGEVGDEDVGRGELGLDGEVPAAGAGAALERSSWPAMRKVARA